MANIEDRLVWIDCEMTGLQLEIDELIEVAVVITDSDLTPVHDGLTIVVKPSDEQALSSTRRRRFDSAIAH
jgi:oligoribonuclease